MTTGTPTVLAWYGCDLLTGRIVEELRSLSTSGPLQRKLGDQATAQLSLALAGAPRDWDAATAPGRSVLVAVDTATNTPLWAGLPTGRNGGSANTVDLGAVTMERYLDSRYPGTQVLSGDQATVFGALVAPALTQGPPFVLDTVATGVTMQYEVDDSDDRSILSVAQELMGAEGGPEFTIDVAWNASHTGFQFPVRIRSRIGVAPTAPVVFDFPGCVSAYALAESYEAGKGATSVIARGDGEGASRLSSPPIVATDLLANGWPLWEYRFTPADGITDPDQLTAHATAALGLMAPGGRAWTVTATASRAPRLGRDWALGDSVHLAVEQSPRHPTGADVTARAWAWTLDPGADQVSPILVEDDDADTA